MRARLVLALACAATAAVGTTTSCGPACRDIEIQRLALSCDPGGTFSGEIHFDDEGGFDTFLAQQCLVDASDEQVQDVMGEVDFSTQGVFVASGPLKASATRCIADRTAERAQVCEDGLKLYFRDRYEGEDPTCAGRWTTAFTLSRADLRAIVAIDDGQGEVDPGF